MLGERSESQHILFHYMTLNFNLNITLNILLAGMLALSITLPVCLIVLILFNFILIYVFERQGPTVSLHQRLQPSLHSRLMRCRRGYKGKTSMRRPHQRLRPFNANLNTDRRLT